MTHADGIQLGDDMPEADVAEQHTLADGTLDEAGLDPTHITTTQAWDANEADLIEQATSVPLPDDDYRT
jgi:hypothetical protein